MLLGLTTTVQKETDVTNLSWLANEFLMNSGLAISQ